MQGHIQVYKKIIQLSFKSAMGSFPSMWWNKQLRLSQAVNESYLQSCSPSATVLYCCLVLNHCHLARWMAEAHSMPLFKFLKRAIARTSGKLKGTYRFVGQFFLLSVQMTWNLAQICKNIVELVSGKKFWFYGKISILG